MDDEHRALQAKLRLLEEELARHRHFQEQQARIETIAASVDNVPIRFATLDSTGGITLHNAAWARIDSIAGIADTAATTGDNYLALLDGAEGATADSAKTAADGIRSVLAGTRSSFAFDHASASGDELHWFTTTVRPVVQEGERGAVVTHRDITGHRVAEAALQHELSFQSALLEQMSEAVIGCDAEGKLRLCNRAARQWYGDLPAATSLGEWFQRVTIRDPAAGVPMPLEDRPLARAFRGERVDGAFFEISRAGESVRYVTTSAHPFYDADGVLLGTVAVATDLTDQRKASADLQESHKRLQEANRKLQLALEAGSACAYEWDLSTNTFRRVGTSLMGIDSDSSAVIPLDRFLQGVHKEDSAALENAATAAMETHTAMRHRFRVVRSDGSVHWLETHGRFEYESDGRPSRLSGVTFDITEHRKAEESQERVAAIIEATTTVIVSIGDGGRIVTWNPAAEQVFGFPFEAVRGKPLSEMLAPEWRTEAERIFEQTRRGVPAGPIDMRAFARDGSALDIVFTCVPVRLRGHIVGGAAIIQNVTAARRTARRLDVKLSQLKALHSVDMSILGAMDSRLALGTIVTNTLALPDVNAVSVLLLDQGLNALRYAAGGGFSTREMSGISMRIGDGFAGTVAKTRCALVAPPTPFSAEHPDRLRIMEAEEFHGYAAFPLIAKGEVRGVLEVFSQATFEPEPDTLEFMEALAAQAAIAIDNAALFEGLQRSNTKLVLAYDATIEGLSRALDLRDASTGGHSDRVTELTLKLAHALDVPEVQMEHIRRGALLHDIGKMGVPDSVLQKPGQLTDAERSIIQMHTVHGFEMLSPIEFLRPAIDIPYCHHERWDGSGYPRGLTGREIPLAARIVAVADVWDALNSGRPYRAAWHRDEALRHIMNLSGIHFDPAVVEEFVKLVG